MFKEEYFYFLVNKGALSKTLNILIPIVLTIVLAIADSSYTLFFLVGIIEGTLVRYELTSEYDVMPITFLTGLSLFFGPVFGAFLLTLLAFLMVPLIEKHFFYSKLRRKDERYFLAHKLQVISEELADNLFQKKEFAKASKRLKSGLIDERDYEMIYSYIDGLSRNNSTLYKKKYLQLNEFNEDMLRIVPSRNKELKTREKEQKEDNENYISEIIEKLNY